MSGKRHNLFLKDNYKQLAFIIVVTLLPKICIALSHYPIRVGDELGTIGVAAYFAGKDWSDIFGIVAYYGTGFHILLTPLFWIFSNPITLYHAILIIYVFLETCIGVIAYYVIKKYFNISDNRFAIIAAIIASYFLHNKATWISNEPVIALLTWCILLILLHLVSNINNKKIKALDTFVLICIMSYSLTVHLRTLIFFVALTGVTFLYYLLKKGWLINIPVAVVTGGVGYFLANSYNTYIQNVIWIANRTESGPLHNSDTLSGMDNITKLLDPQYWHAWLNILFGQINTASIMSIGIICVAIILGIWVLVKACLLRFGHYSGKSEINFNYYFVIFIFFGICALGSLGGQSISWLQHAQDSINLGYGSFDDPNTNFLRVFTYLRYFMPYTGPLILASLTKLYTKMDKKEEKWIWRSSIFFFFFLQFFWIRYVLPYLYKAISVATIYIPFSFSSYDTEAGWHTFLPATIIVSFLFILIFFLFKKKKKILAISIIMMAIIYQYLYYGIFYENDWYNRGDKAFEIISELEEIVDIGKDDIYVPYPAMAYTDQFLLMDYHIICDLPQEDTENVLLFTNRYIVGERDYQYNDLLLYEDYAWIKLDWNEYMYVKGEKYEEALTEAGYSLQYGLPQEDLKDNDEQNVFIDTIFDDYPDAQVLQLPDMSLSQIEIFGERVNNESSSKNLYKLLKKQEGTMLLDSLYKMDIEEMIREAVEIGFDGIYIDRYRYSNSQINALETTIKDILKQKPMTSSSDRFVYYSFDEYRLDQGVQYKESTLFGYFIHVINEKNIYADEKDEIDSWNWCQNEAILKISNSSGQEVVMNMSVEFNFYANQKGRVVIQNEDFADEVEITQERKPYEIVLKLHEGDNFIFIDSNIENVPIEEGNRQVSFRIMNKKMTFEGLEKSE